MSKANYLKRQLPYDIISRGVEAAVNGFVIADCQQKDTPLIYVNPAFERITGYSFEDAVGRNCRFLQGDKTDGSAVESIRDALAAGRVVRTVLKNYKKDGPEFWNDLYIAPVLDDDNNVTHFIGVQNEIEDDRQVSLPFAYNITHDVLTMLPNQSFLKVDLEQLSSTENTGSAPCFGLIHLSFNGIRQINSTSGYRFGNWIINEIGEYLKAVAGSNATVARIGGSEFAVLLKTLDAETELDDIAKAIAERAKQPFELNGQRFLLDCNIGIASAKQAEDDPVSLIQKAELAMSMAMEEDHTSIQRYSALTSKTLTKKLELRGDLVKALENQEFYLKFQPQVNLVSGDVIGCEALLRWDHPKYGEISPGDFIPIAEESGLIRELTFWVMEAACTTLSMLKSNSFKHPIAINLSPILFSQPDIATELTRIVTTRGHEPADFELEIVENLTLQDFSTALSILQDLNSRGFNLAMDDFGTGFSSLSYLKDLPINKLKIDRSFVNDLVRNEKDAAMVETIISIASHFDLEILAEGIETNEQAAFLVGKTCILGQGFFYSKPLATDDYREFLNQSAIEGIIKATGCERNILIVDDDLNILRSLHRLLRKQPYNLYFASNTNEAFDIMATHNIQVMLSDQSLAGTTHESFLYRMKVMYPQVKRLVLSGHSGIDAVKDSINKGNVFKFLMKPWDDQELMQVIQDSFEDYFLSDKN